MTTFKKGYADDIGIDICLDHEIIFRPLETKILDIGCDLPTTCKNRSIMFCARTSAAKQGIIVNQCPVDPGYSGNAHIIAHNCSGTFVTFKAGQAFAQIFAVDVQDIPIDFEIKRQGSRCDNRFGSTDD